ncbi:MAG: DUF4149 domain-containing protein [Pseudomonadota bacterium]
MLEIALLLSALLFGGMVLYSFGFAAFVFNALPPDVAGSLIRRAFPHFYMFVFAVSFVAGSIALFVDQASAVMLIVIAATTVTARQFLMPEINKATDERAKTKFMALHTFSVAITLGHIAASAIVVIRLATA